MNTKHLTSKLIAIVSLVGLTTVACSIEPTSDADEPVMGDDDENTSTAEGALTQVQETDIRVRHSQIKHSGYSYNKSTRYNGQTLEGCANQELNGINNTRVWGHHPCNANKARNLYAAASTSSVPATNFRNAINSWANSNGHRANIVNHSKVGCATRVGNQTMCMNTFGARFKYCRIYSCAYTN
ncbi:MAG: hypothetical protein MUF54_17120 [Polyangiaceae bacterium]|jgi:hypothetical protein|nr:hypothetical protein [Polyangiaceae bacterium]